MAKPLKSLAKSKATNALFGVSEPTGRALKVASRGSSAEAGYTAREIEVVEGLEPVRRRPGMYIGGTDEKALHHLFAEVIDNAMDEALAGHASFIEVELAADGFLTVTDNGRGIPVDPHPKFPKKSALEVIMCTLHAGGKFDSKVYETSGGLHGVGVSVVNALSERLEVEVARGQALYRQIFERGQPAAAMESLGRLEGFFDAGEPRPEPGPPRPFHRKIRQDGGPRHRRMGNRLGCRCRRICLVVLQHHPDPRRRHTRGGPASRPGQGPAGSCGTHGTGQARPVRYQRRRHGRLCGHALGVHPRAGIP